MNAQLELPQHYGKVCGRSLCCIVSHGVRLRPSCAFPIFDTETQTGVSVDVQEI